MSDVSPSEAEAQVGALAAPAPSPLWLRALRWVATGLALLTVAYTLRDADLTTTSVVLRRLGAGYLWVLVPYAVGTWLHAWAWQRLIVATGHDAKVRSLMGILLSAEAVRMTFPGGPALGESMSVVLLRERFGVDARHGVASIAAKKALVTFTNGIVVLSALGLGWGAIRAASERLLHGPWLVALFVGSAVALFALSTSMMLAMVSESIVRRIAAALSKLPIPPLRRWLDDKAHHIAAADSALAAPFARGFLRASWAPGLLLLVQWATEAVETVLVLRLLGVPLDFVSGFASEVAGSLIRSFAFMLPAGVGAQDAGYVTMFDALSGTHLATLGAAFVLVKRSKELFFIVVGYVLLLSGRKSSPFLAKAVAKSAPTA